MDPREGIYNLYTMNVDRFLLIDKILKLLGLLRLSDQWGLESLSRSQRKSLAQCRCGFLR